MYWAIFEDEEVLFFEEPLTDEVIASGDFYSARIYTQRFLPKYVYRIKVLVTVRAGICGDHGVVLMIFDNARECELSPEALETYRNEWQGF